MYAEPPRSPKVIHGRQNSTKSKNFDVSGFSNLTFQASEINVRRHVQISLKENPFVTKAPQASTGGPAPLLSRQLWGTLSYRRRATQWACQCQVSTLQSFLERV